MAVKLFVWDFHGVLEKDNEKAVKEISNIILRRAGFSEQLTDQQNEEYLGLKWYEYFERLLPNITKEKCLELQAACLEYHEADPSILAKNIKPNDYATVVLETIASLGHQQIIISNTRQNDLIWFLETVGMKKFFKEEHIIGVNAHQTHDTKTDALKDFISDKKFDEIVVIGDSESDLELGRAVNAVTYFYRHPNRKHHKTNNADFVINDLRDIFHNIPLVL
jgi:phosphoglycolate phosphatase-like HAD superfamily hydrolase